MNQLTPSACRYHRRALGLTQTGLAKAATSSASYVKMFESGRIKPSQDFLDKLCTHFTAEGIPAEKLSVEYAVSPEKSAPAVIHGSIEGMATLPQVNMGGRIEERQCFFIARDISPSLVEDFLARLDANEERITTLFAKTVKERGFFETTESGYSMETEADLHEVFGLMAENFVLFRFLTGWPILESEAIKADSVAGVIFAHYDELVGILKTAHVGESATPTEEEEVEA